MADDIARLGVAVDSSSAVSAERDIEALAAAGDRATDSARKLSGAWESAKLSPTQLYSANRALVDFRQKAAEASTAAAKVDDSWKKATFSPTQLYSLNKALSAYKQELNQARIASDAVSKASAVQAASHHQVAKAAVGYTKSAKELAFATRNLPAQFTDIAVSLQAGQNPLTVLLQQGGQLKDMFGSVGGAARALGSYVMGLVNVWTVAAAAVAAFTIAAIKGDAESRKLNATLVMQGKSLGVTTSDLIGASESMTRFGQSQAAAADALNTTAASGKIFGDSIQIVAQAALNLEREGGQAIDKTVEQFASLADKPLESALKLDEQYKFLTVSVYEQIRALEEQGDMMGAQEVATKALADTINDRTKEVSENLGYFQQRWRELAGAAKFAWDAMLDIGREDSVQEKIDKLNDQMEDYKKRIKTFGAESGIGGIAVLGLQRVTREFRAVAQQARVEGQKASTERRKRLADEASIELAEAARLGKSNADKRKDLYAEVEEQVRIAKAGVDDANSEAGIEAYRKIEENAAKAKAAIDKKLADPKTAKPKKSQETKDAERLLRDRARDYESLDRALDQHEDQLNAAGQAQDKLSAFERYAIKTLSDLDNGHTSLDIAQRQEIKTRIEALRVIDQENQARDKQAKIMAVSADLHQRLNAVLASQGQEHGREMVGIGRGQNEGQLELTLENIRIKSLQERTELSERYFKLNAIGHSQYIEDLASINAVEEKLTQNEINQLERKRAAMGDWRNGARSAMEDISWEMGDVAGRTRDSFMTAFGAMNSALDNFAKTGKIKIRDFATTVIAELLRIALTIAASKILQSFLGSTVMAGGTGGATYTDSAGFGASDGSFANGAVFSKGALQTFALGGLPFGGMGGVRTSPTLFSMATGTGLMAEQSPEAVMPLARGPNGKLGVKAQGGGGTSITNVSTVVNINQDGGATSSTTSDGDGSKEGKQFADILDKRVRQIIADERLQGGTLWAMVNGR